MLRDLFSCAGAIAGTTLAAALTLGVGAGLGVPVPDLIPVAVFFFAARRTPLLFPVVVLLLGLGADLLYGRTVGIGGFSLLLMAELARQFRDPLSLHAARHEYAGFLAGSLLYASCLWGLGALGPVSAAPMRDLVFQFLGCAIVYPVWHFLLHGCARLGLVAMRLAGVPDAR